MRQMGNKILDSLSGADEAFHFVHLDFKDGDNKLLRNAGLYSQIYTASCQSRRKKLLRGSP